MAERLILYTPTRDEARELLRGPGRFRGWGVCAGALPPPFLFECAIKGGEADWVMPRLYVDEGAVRVVGAGGFKHVPREGRVEIGYAMSPLCFGRGYATQGVRLLCAEGFASALVDEILAETSPVNLASQRVLEKAGFTWYGAGTDHEGPVNLWRKKRPPGVPST